MNVFDNNLCADEFQAGNTASAGVLLCHGNADTRIHDGGSYRTVNWAKLLELVQRPEARPKESAPAIIPSTYVRHDGRSHAAQRANGEFIMLAGDIDRGSPSKAQVLDAIHAVLGEPLDLIVYATASATPEMLKWRFLVRLEHAVAGADYAGTAAALFDAMRDHGIACDRALERPGQLVYLPNVPPSRRGPDSKPLFYDWHVEHAVLPEFHKLVGPSWGLDLAKTEIPARRDAIRQRRASETERLRREAEAKRQARADRAGSEGGTLIDKFNACHAIEDLLEQYGYESAGDGENWRSPHQTSGSFATRVFGDSWYSLSGSDVEAGLGQPAASGGAFGDAFDLFAFFEHGNDARAALQALRAAEVEGMFDELGPDDGADANAGSSEPRKPVGITPTPYVLRDPATIPLRQWIYGRHLIRKFVSATVAPGGAGKSALEIVDALAMATGRTLVSDAPDGKLKVWLWNGEDPLDELDRRIAAACIHYGIPKEDLDGQLFVDSGRDTEIVIAEVAKGGTVIRRPVVDRMIEVIRQLGIDAVIIDPFVSSHRVGENDNNAIDVVVKTWARIADATGCAVSLVHHTRKTLNAEKTGDDARGASSLRGAVRRLRVLNTMTPAEAIKANVTDGHWRYFHAQDDLGKNNMSPPMEKRTWYRMASVALGNGSEAKPSDEIGVVTRWQYETAATSVPGDQIRAIVARIADGCFRANDKSPDWAGHAVAQVLGLDASEKGDRSRIRQLLSDWTRAGYLRVAVKPDSSRRMKDFFEAGDQSPPEDDLAVVGEVEA